VLVLAGCQSASPPASTLEVTVVSASTLPESPSDRAWNKAPEHVAKLIPQDLVEPRLLVPSTPEVRVRAIAVGDDVAFRLEWTDSTQNDLEKPGQFVDACALQVPAKMGTAVPAPQMGEPGGQVEITYWNAGWQAMVNGRGDSIKALYPNAAVDHYPFQAASLTKDSPEQKEMATRYSPARAVGNQVSGPHVTPVQDLIAEGPGTITAVDKTTSRGKGERTETGWAVVIARKLPTGFSAQTRDQIAFAVWQGAAEEVGPRKMRTGWIPLAMGGGL
jgi:DMSO reductase family type II enzyme heme b subunit